MLEDEGWISVGGQGLEPQLHILTKGTLALSPVLEGEDWILTGMFRP